MTAPQKAPSSRTRRGGGAAGVEKALANSHPDLTTLACQWLATLRVGAEFTGGQLWEHLPGYVADHPGRCGAVITNLNRRGFIEFAGYGARSADGEWDRPTRIWRRTDVPLPGGEG